MEQRSFLKVLCSIMLVLVIAGCAGKPTVSAYQPDPVIEETTAESKPADEADTTQTGQAAPEPAPALATTTAPIAAETATPVQTAVTLAPVSIAPQDMVLVPAGTFSMGSSEGERHEKPVHQVTISTPFFMGKYEVTQKEWVEIMGTNPSNFEGDDLPVEQVTWHETIDYCNKRSLAEGLVPAYSGSENSILCNFQASGYRLPTEAEWEWAAKGGGKDLIIYLYSGSSNVDAVAWYNGNSGNKTHPVGTKAPNSLGIYDMSGNVWEWCWDWYWDWNDVYSSAAQTDPAGVASGVGRRGRGGSWDYDARYLRSAFRGGDIPSLRRGDIGFCLVRSSL
jgi:formylglycine-generating enzyme required for sulfatase activity